MKSLPTIDRFIRELREDRIKNNREYQLVASLSSDRYTPVLIRLKEDKEWPRCPLIVMVPLEAAKLHGYDTHRLAARYLPYLYPYEVSDIMQAADGAKRLYNLRRRLLRATGLMKGR